MRRTRSVMLGAAVAAALLAACSSSSKATEPAPGPASTKSSTPSTRLPATSGPAAALSGPITTGNGISLLSATPVDLAKARYNEAEYFASGTAHSFKASSQGTDGRWSVTPDAKATYRTRIIVRRPAAAQFNGTVLVEWLNVSAGSDTSPDFSFAASEITRRGYAWVGVSAQQIGVSGGTGVVPVAGLPKGGLRGSDPARYGSLHHPGDQYALDMYSQIGRAIRTAGARAALGGVQVRRVVAIGESQSAFELTTYINAIQPTTHLFDGFFVHSRGGGATPLGGGNISKGINGGIRIRDDVDVPVFLVETETDEALLRYFDARQPDSAHVRLWDIAGAAHADTYTVGGSPNGLGCKTLINSAPTHFVVAAALAQLDRWIRTGAPPPSAPRMRISIVGDKVTIQRDALGNAIGGVRTAANDVPVATLSGTAGDSSNVLCGLFGSTRPFDAATLARLYSSRAAYLAKVEKATDKAIASGYVLPADRTAIIAEAARAKI